jgi:hypothetical protein
VTIETLPNHIYNRICSQVRPEVGFGGPPVQVYEFGGPRSYDDRDGLPPPPHEERLLLVFPYLEEDILEKARLGKWTDQVVIPAIRQALSAGTLQYFHHSSTRMIQLNSQAGRVEGLRDEADRRLDFYLQPEQLESAWRAMQAHSERAGFEEFRGVCPVIWGQYSPVRYRGASAQAAFQSLVQGWHGSMRMACIPRAGLYVDFVTGGYVEGGEG